jgi:hypothetical protein
VLQEGLQPQPQLSNVQHLRQQPLLRCRAGQANQPAGKRIGIQQTAEDSR